MASCVDVADAVAGLRGYAKWLYSELIPRRAVPPDHGGEGELERAVFLEEHIRSLGFRVERYDARDERARGGVRPNLVVRLGSGEPRLWIVSHIDTVPEGDASAWRYPPWRATFEGDLVYGRGAEDDLQAVVSSLLVLRAASELGWEPPVEVAFAFVSDEEAGSRFGLEYLVRRGLFRGGDVALVPDFCSKRGELVEVAEKHIVWLRVTTIGRQCHASRPQDGLNAARASMMLNLYLDEVLHSKYTAWSQLFDPPVSTFEPTRREGGVANVNTIPGRDVVYWDCRLLPDYDPAAFVDEVRALAWSFAAARGFRVEVEPVNVQVTGPATPPEHPIVRALVDVVREDRGVEAKPIGIGGGTEAGILRRYGVPSVAWQTCDGTAHMPNEYARLSNVVADARVFALLPCRLAEYATTSGGSS